MGKRLLAGFALPTALLILFCLSAVELLICVPGVAGELRREVLDSKSLGREMAFLVYVPDGYENGGQHYPVLYLLHGAGDNEAAWADKGLVREKADQLIESGVIPPTLIVMPGCPGCWWIDGPKEKAETAFWSDLVPTVEKRFRTIERRQGRLLAGLSAGGYGVIRFLMRYPERIAAAAAFSPAVYSEAPPAASAARSQLAFADQDGKFSQSAWEQRNYPALIDQYFNQPTRVPLFLASGDNDRFGAAFESALLFKRMIARQPVLTELRIVDGGHNWAVWAAVIDEAMRYMFRFASRPTAHADEITREDGVPRVRVAPNPRPE